MKRLGMLASFLCAMFLIAPAHSVRAATQKEDAADFFGPDKIYTLHLRMSDEDWQLMQPTRRPRPAALVAGANPPPPPPPARK
jgi:hypothetical protein